MQPVMAEFEKDQISERTKMALSHKKACRERIGTIPFGFDLSEGGVTLVENDAEQATIKVIHELRSRGLSLRDIATELSERKHLTKKGNSKWTHTTVKSILERVA